MAREKDETKRSAILAAAKRLFAKQGFHGTSISDLARETDLPVGSIYTYFENKEALIRIVVEEGWGEFFDGLLRILGTASTPERKIALIVYKILPALFEDVDLISILLSEASRFVGLEEKLDSLTAVVEGLVLELAGDTGVKMAFPTGQAKAALTLYFLGSLDSVRLSRVANLDISPEDIIAFIRLSIEHSFNIDLDPSLAELPA